MKFSYLKATSLVVVLSASAATWYLARQPMSAPVPIIVDKAEKARQTEIDRLKKDGINAPARKGVHLPFEELQANNLAQPTLRTSLLNLDLSRPPSEEELIRAGQLGDPLSPTAPAEPSKMTDATKKAWQEQDNLIFGRAIQAWNEHRYDQAVALFAAHVESSPESPWAGESRLHIGCAAQYRGEYDVCYEQFGKILDSTNPGTDLNQKAQLRVANIQTMQGRFQEAVQSYLEAMKTENSPRRRTYASSWLPVLSIYRKQQTALRDCVQKSLREVCLLQGKFAEAEKVAGMPAMREDGFSVAQVMDVCKGLGLEARGVRVTGKNPLSLSTPFLAHYSDEHFVAVLEVWDQTVQVYDSRVGFKIEISLKSFISQWSGAAISLVSLPSTDKSLVALSGLELNLIVGGCCGVMPYSSKFDNSPNENSPCASGPRGQPGQNPWQDAPPTDDTSSAMASPSWAFNPVSSNMMVRDVPMWWDSPYGLDVTFTLSFNSLDSLNAIRPMGDKWVLNYCAYAMEDPSGKVTIVAGNGNQWIFHPASGGGYTAPTNFPCSLVKTGPYEYQVTHLETDTVFLYGRPVGVSTAASLFISATDKWGVSVSMSHNSNGALTAVTHSIGGVWDIVYNSDGKMERIDDPFGRSCYFSYDSSGVVREIEDMGGLKYAFKYSTSAVPVNSTPDNQLFLTEIVYAPQELSLTDQPNRTWHPLTYQFLTQPPDGDSDGMWGNFEIATTALHGGTKSVAFWGDFTPHGTFKTAAQNDASSDPHSGGTKYAYTLVNGEGQISNITYASGGTASFSNYNSAAVPQTVIYRNSVSISQTVNSFERPLTITDSAGRVTTLEYENNGMDLMKITGRDSLPLIQFTYNGNRQPTTITRRDGRQVVMTYNTHGQISTQVLKDIAGSVVQTTTLTYNTGDRVSSVDVDGRTVASYTYDSIGRVVTITDEDNNVTTQNYDALNRITKVIFHDATFIECAFHPVTGMVAWEQDRDGQRTLFFYDRRGYRVANHALGQRLHYFNYNNDGQMTLLIDPKGNRTAWEYDIEGRIIKKVLDDNAVEQLSWNNKNQLTAHSSPRGLNSLFTYDTLGRRTSTAYQSSTGATLFPTKSVTYDLMDRIVTTTDGEGTTSYSYDDFSRLNSVDGPYSNDTVSYDYDDFSRVDEITTPGGITQSFIFDSDQRLSSWVDVFGSGNISYAGRTKRVLGISRAGGLLTTSFSYTAGSDMFKLAQIKHEIGSSLASQFDYTWSARQDIKTWQRKLGSTVDRETKFDLRHNAAHQLVSATLNQISNNAIMSDQRWGFDSIGNRVSENDLTSNSAVDYIHNSTNQLVNKMTYISGQKPWVNGNLDEQGRVKLGSTSIPVRGDNSFEAQAPSRSTNIVATDNSGNTTQETWLLNSGSGTTPDTTLAYTHDSEGNLLGDGTSSYEWDLKNRLTAIVTGSYRTEFTYDGSDRRVQVVEREGGIITSNRRYVFQGMSLLEERAEDNSTVLRRFYDGGHVEIAEVSKRYVYTNDHLRSIREVLELEGASGNPTGATIIARYDYDLWGKRTVLDGGTSAQDLVMHGYTGHVYHRASGLWLAPYRAYNTELGRWISRDPIAEDGGLNLYAYVDNMPSKGTDPLGLRISIVTGKPDFLGVINRDFAYRMYANWVSNGSISEQGYAEAMNAANQYIEANSPVSSVYAFAGWEGSSGQGSVEALGIFGVDAVNGETFGGGLAGPGWHGVTVAPEYENQGGHGHWSPIVLFEPGHTGWGGWTTGDESGGYASASAGGFFVGLGVGFFTDKIQNLFNPDYWTLSMPVPDKPQKEGKKDCK